MKDAIRAARRRWRLQTSAEKPVGVVLTREAHSILERISQRDGVTLSEAVVKYLGREDKDALEQKKAGTKCRLFVRIDFEDLAPIEKLLS